MHDECMYDSMYEVLCSEELKQLQKVASEEEWSCLMRYAENFQNPQTWNQLVTQYKQEDNTFESQPEANSIEQAFVYVVDTLLPLRHKLSFTNIKKD